MAGIRRPMSQMRKIECKESLFRARKHILKCLVHGYLKQEGYFHSAETFASEAAMTGEFEVCDNIDLDIILQLKMSRERKRRSSSIVDMALVNAGIARNDPQCRRRLSYDLNTDYCSYYLMRFNKQPQFCRKVNLPPELTDPQPRRPPTRGRSKAEHVLETVCEKEKVDLPSTFTITRLTKEEDLKNLPTIETKSLAGFLTNVTPDRKQLVEMLYQDIIRPSGVSWSDVKGLSAAKNLLMESVVYPVRHPEVFTGILEPWRGILLHGPPGTGKTMLARAVASESSCTFFNVSCSTIVNKWRGDSEKIVKTLFDMASYYSPSIIFIDEVETLASDRSGPGEHEASRRLKAQLLTELDGIVSRDGIIFLLANSNMPWEIDPAMLRRLEKRIFIPLPDSKTREELFHTYLTGKTIELYPKVDFKELAAKTEGYSGSDVKLVCKEALMSSVRKMLPTIGGKGNLQNNKDKLVLADILTAIEKTKPVSKNLARRHIEWQNEMGCS